MAEAFLNHLARQRGLPIVAESAGTLGGRAMNAVAIRAMAEAGLTMTKQEPKLINAELASRADKIISMGDGVDAKVCPFPCMISEDWGLDSSRGQPIERLREIRDQIRNRVEELLCSLEPA